MTDDIPTGTVTFLFTDIEGSTRLWEDHTADMEAALERHDQIMREVIGANGGYVFSTAGDAFVAAFGRTGTAIRAATDLQRAIGAEDWPDTTPLKIRIGIHTGESQERDGDYFGPALNRAARICSAGHGGQTLVSSATAALIAWAGLGDLGEHQLKDLGEPEQIFQLPVDGAPADFPPLRSLNTVRHNLPVQRTSLYGREDDVMRIRHALENHRLVTLTGIGGVGKTRLALAAAGDIAEEFSDGVFFVDLTPTASTEQVGPAIAAALGLQVEGPLRAQVVEFVTARNLLLVLDNCEHVIDEVADLVDVLLDAPGRAKVLATSRESLEVDGEQTMRVGSLPGSGQAGEPGPGARLLVARAQAAGAEVDLDETIESICERLDGIPLAIELAAAQLPVLSPRDLLSRLGERFDLLTGGRRRRRQRQQTLQAMMDWSWELLTESERRVLARLAVFVGSWDLQAAEGVCGGDQLTSVTVELGSLVHKSLVQRVESTDETRYRMLETVRLYAQQRLVDSGEADTIRSRHLAWYVGRIEEVGVDVQFLSLAHMAWYQRNSDNISSAIDWAVARQEFDAAATLVMCGGGVAFNGWLPAGPEMVRLNDELLRTELSATTRARLLATSAFLAFACDPVTVDARIDAALDAAESVDDPFSVAVSHAALSMGAARPELRTWSAAYDRASNAATAVDSTLLHRLATSLLLNNPSASWIDAEAVLARVRADDDRDELVGLYRFSDLHSAVGLALTHGDIQTARWASAQIDELRRRFGLRRHWSADLNEALIAAFGDDADEARERLRSAIERDRSTRAGPGRSDWLLVPAAIASTHNDPTTAAVRLQVIATHPVPLGSGTFVAIWRHLRDLTINELDTDALDAARSQARDLNADQLIAEFLGDDPA